MIVIFLHPLPGNREFIYSTRTNRRSSLTTQDYLLRKFFIILLIFMWPIIKSRNIHYCRHIIIDYSIRRIHPLCDRTCRIFTMTKFLQKIRHLRSFISIPLFGNLISDAPHHHTRIITIMTQQVRQILYCPFVKNMTIAVLNLHSLPFIKRFRHHHHSHLITSSD